MSAPGGDPTVPTTQPAQFKGQLKQAQGQVYNTIGKIIPDELGAGEWKDSGATLQNAGKEEVGRAKRQQAIESVIDRTAGLAKTAIGYVMGDQALQSSGNAEAAKATAAWKQARSDKVVDPPVPSQEGLAGLKQTVTGALTGDIDQQTEGNLRTSKATLKDGV